MMAYATVDDVQARITRTLSADERALCSALIVDAAVLIDAYNSAASEEIKQYVTIRMAVRVLGDGTESGYPLGATQGSISGLGYSQSWTLSGGANGELYLNKTEKKLLGAGNNIGSYSPIQELAGENA